MTQLAFNSFLVAMLSVPVVTLISRRWTKARSLPPVLLMGSLVVGTAVAAVGFWEGQRFTVDVSQVASFSFALGVDRLSAFFLLLICSVSLPVILFSSSYIPRHYAGARRHWLWVLLPLFLLSMVLVVTASTPFAFLFGWELMTLFSAGLILIDGDSEQRRHNIFIYLLMMHAGAAAVIGAFLLFLPHASNFAQMRASAALMPALLRTAVFLLAFVGFGTKAGIVPLHLWLPRAHPIAPSPVSALMSGVMLKTAVYGLVRFAFDFLGGGPSWWGYLVLFAGAISGLLGVLYAIGEHDLKRLLAYHSVENIGIIYLGLGAALVFTANHAPLWASLALTAALLHCLNHAIFKSLLFVGLPLFNGFVSEWLTFRSFLAASELTDLSAAIVLPLAAGVLALIGGLAAACFAKVYGVAFLGRPRSREAGIANEVSLPMQAGMGALATACVVIGVFPGLVLRSLGNLTEELLPGAALPQAATSLSGVLPWIALFVLVLVAGIAAVKRAKSLTATWACGLPGLDERMQYTSTAFSKPLRRVFSEVYKADRTLEVVPGDPPYFPASISYRSVRTTSFEKFLYRPGVDAIVAAALRLRQLQTGNIQIYLLYIFAALIALLMFMRFV